jgi:hypothetical protein
VLLSELTSSATRRSDVLAYLIANRGVGFGRRSFGWNYPVCNNVQKPIGGRTQVHRSVCFSQPGLVLGRAFFIQVRANATTLMENA